MSDHIQRIYEELQNSTGVYNLTQKIEAYQALGVNVKSLGSSGAHVRLNIMGTERNVYFFRFSSNSDSRSALSGAESAGID